MIVYQLSSSCNDQQEDMPDAEKLSYIWVMILSSVTHHDNRYLLGESWCQMIY